MNIEDVLVGTVSLTLGVIGVAAAIGNWDRYYRLDKIQWLERRFGRPLARCVYGAGGFALIGLGIIIALGVGRRESATPLPDPDPVATVAQ